MSPAQIFSIVGGILLILFFFWVHGQTQEALKDPDNTDFIYLHQLYSVALITGEGAWAVRIDRQSGNLHKYLEGDGTAADAIEDVVRTFQRAKIDTVIVKVNTLDRLELVRMFHNHRGSNEGRKVGAASIRRLNRPAGSLGAAGMAEK